LNSSEQAAAGAADSEAGPGEGGDANTSPPIVRLFNTDETYYAADPEFVRLLTPEQKKRLADVLFNVKQVTDEEASLIELVKDWGDPRFVPFALAQLRGFGDDPPYIAEALVTALADILGNEGLTKLAAKYCENSTYYDEDSEDGAAGDAAAAVVVSGEHEPAEEKAEEDPAEKAYEDSLVGNSAQKRTQRLQRFLARAEVALAK
jgi:hypothetical protein